MYQPCHPGGAEWSSCWLRIVWAQTQLLIAEGEGPPPHQLPRVVLSWHGDAKHILTPNWGAKDQGILGETSGDEVKVWHPRHRRVGTRDSFVDGDPGWRTPKGNKLTLIDLGYLRHWKFILCKTEPLSSSPYSADDVPSELGWQLGGPSGLFPIPIVFKSVQNLTTFPRVLATTCPWHLLCFLLCLFSPGSQDCLLHTCYGKPIWNVGKCEKQSKYY